MRDANAHELDQPAERPARTLIVDGGVSPAMRGKLALLTGMVIASGAPLEMLPDLSPRKPKIFTHADEERIAKAEAKRQRKAARRLKLTNPSPLPSTTP